MRSPKVLSEGLDFVPVPRLEKQCHREEAEGCYNSTSSVPALFETIISPLVRENQNKRAKIKGFLASSL